MTTSLQMTTSIKLAELVKVVELVLVRAWLATNTDTIRLTSNKDPHHSAILNTVCLKLPLHSMSK